MMTYDKNFLSAMRIQDAGMDFDNPDRRTAIYFENLYWQKCEERRSAELRFRLACAAILFGLAVFLLTR